MLKDLAVQRMRWLFRRGVEALLRGDRELACRYGQLIRAIALRSRTRIPRSIRRWICKNCSCIMVPGLTARVRIRREGKTLRIVTTCLICGYIHRYEFLRGKDRHEAERQAEGAEEAEGCTAPCRRKHRKERNSRGSS
ncbi:MAG: ribonuclease P [Crenarchaeota archaeon]|nr:ribonuclease P [Thermoproteota archaeon]